MSLTRPWWHMLRMGSKMAQLVPALSRERSVGNPTRKLSVDLAESELPPSDKPQAGSPGAQSPSACRPNRSGSSRSLVSPLRSPSCSWSGDELGRQGARYRGRTPSPCASEDFVVFHTVFHKKHRPDKAGHSSAPTVDGRDGEMSSLLCL